MSFIHAARSAYADIDADEFGDMLFSSQESFDDGEEDVDICSEPDPEVFDDGSDSDLDIWTQPSADTLTITDMDDTDADADMLDFGEETDMAATELCDPSGDSRIAKDSDWVVAHVESMLEGIVDALLADDSELSITMKTRPRTDRRKNTLLARRGGPQLPRMRKIRFPGANAKEAWRFTVLVRILELIHDCLTGDVIITKRDMYYRQPDLFLKQSVVDQYVDDLACTFGVTRAMLNVTAAAKGLAAGNFIIKRGDGTSVNGLSENEGILVPKLDECDVLDLSSVRWVLVIEKEATFRAILSPAQWMRLGSQGLIVTAKGYPDLASRKFLRQVADRASHIPMFALVDFDPDGISILSTYKHGSARLAHENAAINGAPALSLPQLRWLGVRSHQLCRTPPNEGDTDDDTLLGGQGMMRLTPRDRTKACQMLEWDLCAEDGLEPTWRRELQVMLMLNIKAEMQILEELPGGLVPWLERELRTRSV